MYQIFEKQNKSNYSLKDSENKLVVPFPGTIATWKIVLVIVVQPNLEQLTL